MHNIVIKGNLKNCAKNVENGPILSIMDIVGSVRVLEEWWIRKIKGKKKKSIRKNNCLPKILLKKCIVLKLKILLSKTNNKTKMLFSQY